MHPIPADALATVHAGISFTPSFSNKISVGLKNLEGISSSFYISALTDFLTRGWCNDNHWINGTRCIGKICSMRLTLHSWSWQQFSKRSQIPIQKFTYSITVELVGPEFGFQGQDWTVNVTTRTRSPGSAQTHGGFQHLKLRDNSTHFICWWRHDTLPVHFIYTVFNSFCPCFSVNMQHLIQCMMTKYSNSS